MEITLELEHSLQIYDFLVKLIFVCTLKLFSQLPHVAVTTIVWETILDLNPQSQEFEFNSLTGKSASQIEDQLKTHEQVLIGFRGLF